MMLKSQNMLTFPYHQMDGQEDGIRLHGEPLVYHGGWICAASQMKT